MKKKVYYIILSLILAFLSCKEEHETDYYKIGEQFLVTSKNYTTLDNEVQVDIQGFNVSSVAVTHLGGLLADGKTPFTAPKEDLGTITIDPSGVGTIKLPDTDLGVNVSKTTANLKFTAQSKVGIEIVRKLTVTVQDPFSITKPTALKQENKAVDFKYVITPITAAVSAVGVQIKKSFNGTYADIAGPFASTGTIKINGSNYNIGDTIYIKITATTNAPRTAVSVTKLVVGMYSFPTTTSGIKLTPSITTSIYDLAKRRYIKNADEIAKSDSVDIKYTNTAILGGFTLGFTAPKNAQFIKVTGTPEEIAKVFSDANAVTISASDFSSSITSDPDVAVGNVYIYRTKRGDAAYTYGVFKITAIAKPEGIAANSYFSFDLKNI